MKQTKMGRLEVCNNKKENYVPSPIDDVQLGGTVRVRRRDPAEWQCRSRSAGGMIDINVHPRGAFIIAANYIYMHR
jgi:hypothetical protein